MFTLFSHIGIVVRDLDAALARWTGDFGLTVVERMEVEVEGIRNAFLSTGGAYGEATLIELIAPLDPENPDLSKAIPRRLAEHGEGVFHIAMRARDEAKTQDLLEAAGIRAFSVPPAGPQQEPRMIIHPASANGVLLELLFDA